MDVETGATPSESYTILRIKRKRNEEPLDALVVEASERRKKSRGGIGVFKFAQTVESDAWDDERQAKGIQDQISRLARESSVVSEARPVSSAPPRPKSDAPHYTILSREDIESDNNRTSRPTNPPKVISSKDLPSKISKSDYRMFDAVLAKEKLARSAADAEMEKFLPMLNDYLKLDDGASNTVPVREVALSPGQQDVRSADYVYDIFYRSPTAFSNGAGLGKFATLSGLPPSITDPYDSASESEEEDEADEDSNAEEYYKNDYPEDEEASDSDEFYEDSDYSESNHEWR